MKNSEDFIIWYNRIKCINAIDFYHISKNVILCVNNQNLLSNVLHQSGNQLSPFNAVVLSFSHSFLCKSCGKHWYSARVVVLFRYRLRGNLGTVVMRPFRQSCRRCEEKFEAPGFSKKAVANALLELFYKIRKNCYGHDSAISKMGLFKPHEASLCEACFMGVCYQEGN